MNLSGGAGAYEAAGESESWRAQWKSERCRHECGLRFNLGDEVISSLAARVIALEVGPRPFSRLSRNKITNE